ncbi:DUF2975 domain-containing protein [Dyadobacter psychrotolerans]|uniref:DUF2975 domain-containing protein n=1 Tax=Dyadobacter psychrotolerans TaxID=2541721 RepID=A0A4R5DS39_9BACT|nr:DUF2975 domain-containing protein [Dyadobacter psychrotolerans]TDE17149.1 DUF2975 domain-containing protein [Dyadobacter psychrotolerans]
MKTDTKTKQILQVMHVLTWIAFIGLMIEAGAILVSYAVSCVNPEAVKNLYKDLNLEELREFSFWQYTMSVSFLVAISGMKAYVLFLVIQALSKVNLENPFTIEVVLILEKISYNLLGVWIVAVINNRQTEWLLRRTGITSETLAAEEFIFMAGLVFIISQVFKRGVEIQSENDLTV